ncbi:hypothetical protein CO726_24760 [Bacillus fungorum]|uniref:Uncharacterized protein n=1 Tax=Bacillus fungorum TaxID=2039284 RepID=A0A2G6Q7N8_9BACI|nr:hypothetical protein [Bacillus fungorum]PIE92781.1 hypothetical protein CO726_24760 [Bacillus fungorum]
MLKKIFLSIGISLLVVGTFTEELFSLFGLTVPKDFIAFTFYWALIGIVIIATVCTNLISGVWFKRVDKENRNKIND